MKTKFTIASMLLLLLAEASAHQLSPVGTQAERKFAKRWGTTIKAEIAISESALHNFSDPVHETLTQRIFGCDGDWDDCADPDLEYAGPYVIAGLRWNDDPVFMLAPGEAANLPCSTKDTVSFVTQTRCWVGLFRDAERKSAADPIYFKQPGKGTYLTRSHFGDLQFLHAMASEDGEAAGVTKAKILMWAQFTWGVIEGKYRLDTPLRDIPIDGWKTHFTNGHTVQDLLTMGRPAHGIASDEGFVDATIHSQQIGSKVIHKSFRFERVKCQGLGTPHGCIIARRNDFCNREAQFVQVLGAGANVSAS